jgi:hypothetical protein
VIITSAGRRIDELDAKKERFPLRNADRVAEETRSRFKSLGVSLLVCSAACGADLIALNASRSLGIRSRIVLPFAPQRFRGTSVVDRPGNSTWNWGTLFDELVERANETNDLVVLSSNDAQADDETAAYIQTNQRLITESMDLSRTASDNLEKQIKALIIWEGESRGEDDMTGDFANRARQAGIPLEEVNTV